MAFPMDRYKGRAWVQRMMPSWSLAPSSPWEIWFENLEDRRISMELRHSEHGHDDWHSIATSFVSYRTSHYKLHYYETPTSLKFVMLTDTKTNNLRLVLHQIYISLYVEYGKTAIKHARCKRILWLRWKSRQKSSVSSWTSWRCGSQLWDVWVRHRAICGKKSLSQLTIIELTSFGRLLLFRLDCWLR